MDSILLFSISLPLAYLVIDAYVVLRTPRRVVKRMNIKERGLFLIIGLMAIMLETTALVTTPMALILWVQVMSDAAITISVLLLGAALGAIVGKAVVSTRFRTIIENFVYFDVPIQFRPSR